MLQTAAPVPDILIAQSKIQSQSQVKMAMWELCVLARIAAASFVVYDPSDVVGTLVWTADNALVADYSIPFVCFPRLKVTTSS